MLGVKPLLLVTALFLLAACSMRGQPEPGASGSEIYAVAGCIACHGSSRDGASIAPSLHNLGSNWNVEELSMYLEDPSTWIEGSERMQKVDQSYTGTMPAFDNLDLQERQRLAAWLIAQD